MLCCPKCNTPVRGDGLLEMCSGCGIYLRVEDDRVDAYEPPSEDDLARAPQSDVAPPPPAETQSFEPLAGLDEIEGFSPEPPVASPSQEPEEPLFPALTATEDAPAELAQISEPTNSAALAPSQVEAPSDDIQLFDEPQPEPAPEPAVDVSAFANSDVSSARDGHYLYDIVISRIDSKEIRDRLREALDDRRMGWRVDEVMGAIRSGSLALNRLNPVHASVVVQRCKSLPVKIRWEQNGLVEEE